MKTKMLYVLVCVALSIVWFWLGKDPSPFVAAYVIILALGDE
jgi:hypothetical protein